MLTVTGAAFFCVLYIYYITNSLVLQGKSVLEIIFQSHVTADFHDVQKDQL